MFQEMLDEAKSRSALAHACERAAILKQARASGDNVDGSIEEAEKELEALRKQLCGDNSGFYKLCTFSIVFFALDQTIQFL
mgnify:CR=1 FL=1